MKQLVIINNKMRRYSLSREFALKAEVVKVVVVADQGILGHWVERVDDILPDSTSANVRVLLDSTAETLALQVVVNDHVTLRRRNTGGFPGKPFGLDDSPVEYSTNQNPADSGPDFALFVQCLGLAQSVVDAVETKDCEEVSDQFDGDAGSTSLVKTFVGLGSENIGLLEPVLEGLARQMGTQFGQKELTEFGVFAFSEDLPYILVAKSAERGDLKLEQMVLVRVHVNGVNAFRAFLEVVQNVVTGTCNGQNDILTVDVQQTVVDTGIFPVESVDVLVLELRVLGKLIVVVDTVVVVLVKGRWERKVGAKVDDGRFVCLGLNLRAGFLNSVAHLLSVLGGRQVW